MVTFGYGYDEGICKGLRDIITRRLDQLQTSPFYDTVIDLYLLDDPKYSIYDPYFVYFRARDNDIFREKVFPFLMFDDSYEVTILSKEAYCLLRADITGYIVLSRYIKVMLACYLCGDDVRRLYRYAVQHSDSGGHELRMFVLDELATATPTTIREMSVKVIILQMDKWAIRYCFSHIHGCYVPELLRALLIKYPTQLTWERMTSVVRNYDYKIMEMFDWSLRSPAGNTMLHYACRTLSWPAIRYAVERHPSLAKEVNKRGRCPLMVLMGAIALIDETDADDAMLKLSSLPGLWNDEVFNVHDNRVRCEREAEHFQNEFIINRLSS